MFLYLFHASNVSLVMGKMVLGLAREMEMTTNLSINFSSILDICTFKFREYFYSKKKIKINILSRLWEKVYIIFIEFCMKKGTPLPT